MEQKESAQEQGAECNVCVTCVFWSALFLLENQNKRECRRKELSDKQAQAAHADTVFLSCKIYQGSKLKKQTNN